MRLSRTVALGALVCGAAFAIGAVASLRGPGGAAGLLGAPRRFVDGVIDDARAALADARASAGLRRTQLEGEFGAALAHGAPDAAAGPAPLADGVDTR